MTPIVFLNLITILGIGYMLKSNIRLFNVLRFKMRSSKYAPESKEKLHFREHLSLGIFVFVVGALGIFGLITGNEYNRYSELTSGLILDTMISTLPYVLIGFVCDHLRKEEGDGKFSYDCVNCDKNK